MPSQPPCAGAPLWQRNYFNELMQFRYVARQFRRPSARRMRLIQKPVFPLLSESNVLLEPRRGAGYAAYAWSADGRQATLAPESGLRGTYDFGGGRSHSIPSVADCKVCHEGRPAPIIGFSLLQLSPDRDPNALHADPRRARRRPAVLGAGGAADRAAGSLLTTPPRIEAASPTERAVLGYLTATAGIATPRTASCRTSASSCAT